jgi:hypothetical protein
MANEKHKESAVAKPFKLLGGAVLERGEGYEEWFVQGGELEIDDGYLPVLGGAGTSGVMLMKPGVGGGITIGSTCTCKDGSGTCDTIIKIDGQTGKKTVKCTSNTCTGGCGVAISVPANSGVVAPA